MLRFKSAVLCLLVVSVHGARKDDKNKEVVSLEDAQKMQLQGQDPSKGGWAQAWYNAEEPQMAAAMPYPYQGYGYYQAPAGNAFMQPRGFNQYALQQQSTYQVQPSQAYQQSYQQNPSSYQVQPAQLYQQPFQTLPMQLTYPQSAQYTQPFQAQQPWQTLPDFVGNNYFEVSNNVQQVQPESIQVQATSDADTTRAEEMTVSSINAVSSVNAAPTVNAVALPAAVQSPASTWSAPLWADSGNSQVPTWRRSFTPLPGQSGCYNRCRPSCSNDMGGCQPSCRSACNIRPSCPRRSEVQFAGSTMVCARPGYNFQNQNLQTFQNQNLQAFQNQNLQAFQNQNFQGQTVPSPYYGQQNLGGWYEATNWGMPVNQAYSGASQGLAASSAKLSAAPAKSAKTENRKEAESSKAAAAA